MPPLANMELVVSAEAVHGGHVNNVKYLEFLEMARKPWYQYFSTLGFRSFMAHLNVEYKKEAFLGDHLLIHTVIEQVGNTSLVLRHTMKNQNEEYVLQAHATFVAISVETGEKIRVPDELREDIDEKTR
ncbi:thioesterase family protein [Brevibacillus choshinensis]|uniref:acyl-CoA thioesterase n=1 Tax=Brevibacillus choshinensis TaxID=54911 RepID=UPI002E207C8A|nr:thioesterase family protein [Brevibacillus choshinensis]